MSTLAAGRRIERSSRGVPYVTSWTRHRTSVRAIEPQGERALLVCWCDPTCCQYIDQRWTNVTARKNGRCALTGRPIRRGDSVFRPQSRGLRAPGNRHEMILSAAVTTQMQQGGVCGPGTTAIRQPLSR
ncbi:DUF3331 domain-containing protein [Paraburkholderia sp. DHOC27]|uniref:DUF3331 domain-containing protein n=1 Tax=Paraburkholderia sp. DHOC27 TaxID=2303330 RepID=UPI0038578087